MPKKVLVADDEVYLAELIKDMLTDDGYEIDTANDGNITLENIKQTRPDLIILDVMMPGMDGFDVSFYVSLEKDYHPKIIMLTGKERTYDKNFGQVSGANLYLTKPFDLEVLREKVKELLADTETKK